MPITSEEITQVLEKHRKELVAHMIEETKTEISRKVNWELGDQISNIVTKFVSEEIAPEIRSQLAESKPVILKAVADMAEQFSTDLTKALLDQAGKNLKESYKRSQILKELFS
jgi:hypothetical protein